MFEKEFIDWVAARNKRSPGTLIGVGDDACLLAASRDSLVMTTDTLCDQVHFDCLRHSLTRIGRKCLAVNVSDILAMGARPAQALLTFVLPRDMTLDQAKEIYLGAEEIAAAHRVDIVGGDTNRHDGPLMVSASLVGYVDPQRVWRIDHAQVGDDLVVTGSLGGSILGKHLDFEPPTGWVQSIAKQVTIHAATDISDSLSMDVAYMARKSGVGIWLDGDKIPVSEAAVRLARESGRTPLDHALSDGEDFELLLSVEPAVTDQILALHPDSITRIGRVIPAPDLQIQVDGETMIFEPKGYEH